MVLIAPPPFVVDERFCYRTPLLPLSALTEMGADIDTARARLRDLVARPEIRDAIFIASPDLHTEIPAWLEAPDSGRGRRVERALIRYLSRMAGRATPFGAFSGVSVGRFGDETALAVEPIERHRRHTRLDHDYLFALCAALRGEPALGRQLAYTVNSSLYATGDRVRYVEERLHGRIRSHQLVSVEPSEALEACLRRARGGATRDALVQHLLGSIDGASREEVEGFVGELIASQILVARLSPAVTGGEALDGVAATLRPLEAGRHPAEVLDRVKSDLEAIDRDGLGAAAARYRALASRLDALPAEVDLRRLFQVDLAKPSPQSRLHRRIAGEVARGIELLHRLTRPREHPALARFREEFAARFETREIPLMDALDEESGIGFGSASTAATDASPLLAGIPLPGPGREHSAPSGPAEQHLLRLYARALERGDREIALTRADVDAMSVTEPSPLPHALAAMAVVIAESAEALDRGDYKLLLEPPAGPSGMRLVGRFCHLDPEIEAMVRDHIQREEAHRPGAAFAEIAHLPEGRAGNILCRPVLRDYEIPYLGESGAPSERQIPLDDLRVRLERGRIVLRSARLDREVIPRLTNAHNFLRGLGVYRFLCALQSQGTGRASWSWGPLESAPALPRVTCGKLVLSRARWRLCADELAPLAEASRGAKSAKSAGEIRALVQRQVAAARALRAARTLPRFVVLADDDHELPVDFDNPLSVESFVQLVRSRSSALLLELLPGPDALVASGPAGRFVHELIVSMVREPDRDASSRPAPRARPPKATRPPAGRAFLRRFGPGSPWLYARIYAGWAALDDLLRDVIAPLTAGGRGRELFERWFFLRYADPDPHLRVRYAGPPARLWGELLPMLSRALAPRLESGVVWRFDLGTYEREVERYGGPLGVEICEQIFTADSDAVLGIVERLAGDAGADARWRLALRGADQLLDDLGFDLEGKLRVIGGARETFGREFRAGTSTMKQLGKRYRAEREALAALFARDPDLERDHPLAPGFALLEARSERVRAAGAELQERAEAGALSEPLDGIAWSLVHMHVNRLLRSSHRAQELVIYDLLKRHYASVRARGGGTR